MKVELTLDQALDTLQLLSKLEVLVSARETHTPDYIFDQLATSVESLRKGVVASKSVPVVGVADCSFIQAGGSVADLSVPYGAGGIGCGAK